MGTTSTAVETPATTPQASASTSTSPTTTVPEPILYAVVAEERARRLSVLDPADVCLSATSPCDIEPLIRFDLSERPHNMTGVGPIVYATHPAAGAISRVDVEMGSIMTVPVGIEPHDIKYAPELQVLFVADEAGRRLLTLDPDTLELLGSVDLPAQPHDLALDEGIAWVTLRGRSQIARVHGENFELFETGGSPHDVIVDDDGMIWFSNWGSSRLSIFDPVNETTTEAPAGVTEPHHFAIDVDGTVWVSDNGGASIVGFGLQPQTVEVGPVPHHLAVAAGVLVVAVSGSGQAVLIRDAEIVGRSGLSEGLHGVAVVELVEPIPATC